MRTLLQDLLLFAEKPPHEEGRDIVLSMLVVGGIFLAVVVLGELSKAVAHRRRRR
jgi:hypothetical protein